MTAPPGGLTRRRAWIGGAAFAAAGVGLPLAFRAVSPDDPVFPSGARLVPYLLGVGVVVLIVPLFVYGGRHPVEQVSLPRAVRSAVRWRDTVPEQYRDQVPGWLAYQRRLCAQLVLLVLFMVSAQLQAGRGGTATPLIYYVLLLAVFLVPIGIYAGIVEHARRHFAGSLPSTR